MPASRSNNAPYFSGQPGNPLVDSLLEYDGLAFSLSLKRAWKVETVVRYVPANTRELWMTLDSYTLDRKVSRSDLEDLYPDIAAGKRYTKDRLSRTC